MDIYAAQHSAAQHRTLQHYSTAQHSNATAQRITAQHSNTLTCDLYCRPGNGAMPMKFCPTGTQVGTPAWVPDSVEEDDGMTEESGVAKHWFVHLRRISGRPSDRMQVKLDTAGTNTAMSSRPGSGISANWPSGSSLVSIGQDGTSLQPRLCLAAWSSKQYLLSVGLFVCLHCLSGLSVCLLI